MVYIVVKGKNYYTYTLISWLSYIKDMIKQLTCTDIILKHVHNDNEIPELWIDNEKIYEGLPDNEGELLEVIVYKLHKLGYLCREDF